MMVEASFKVIKLGIHRILDDFVEEARALKFLLNDLSQSFKNPWHCHKMSRSK